MKKQLKTIPRFKDEDEEREFWATHDSTEYFDWDNAVVLTFPNLKFSTETISLRMPQDLLDDIKLLANKKDMPYQSLMKQMLDQAVREEKGELPRREYSTPYSLVYDKSKQPYSAKKKVKK